ncbi:MAG TPA: tetratricopeptide repeat protein [Bacteroidales bacterium]|jgi:Flp pilus assembly protein TadD|nr:tetratricopeptide repeat protein [Bacteroidales bacterium]
MKRTLFYMAFSFITILAAGQKPVFYLMKGKAFIDAGNPGEAVSVLTSAMKDNHDASFYLWRGEAYLAKGDFSSAIDDFNSANKMTAASGEYGLARIYAMRNDAATAVYHLELSMRSPFRKNEKEILTDPSFAQLENKAEWRQFWKKDWYSTPEKRVAEIEYNISTGNLAEAKNIFRALSSSYPDDVVTGYSSALISIAGSMYGDAVRTLTRIVSENPGDIKCLRLLASAQELSGNPAGASASYTRLIDMNVADPELLLSRAGCYRKTGETEKAMDDITMYLEFYPGNKKALSLAGKAASAAGDNILALSYFSENVRLHPNDPECFIDRANSYFMSRSWEWAAKDYGMSLDLQPGNAEVWLNNGISLLNMGKTEDACYNFRKAFILGNRNSTEYLGKYCIK